MEFRPLLRLVAITLSFFANFAINSPIARADPTELLQQITPLLQTATIGAMMNNHDGAACAAPSNSRTDLQCPSIELMRSWQKEYHRGASFAGTGLWAIPAPDQSCVQGEVPPTPFSTPAQFEEYLAKLPETSVHQYPQAISHCLNYSNLGNLSRPEKKTLIATFYYLKKKLEMGTLAAIKSVADYDDLLGISPWHHAGSCGRGNIEGSVEACQYYKHRCHPTGNGNAQFKNLMNQTKNAMPKLLDLESRLEQKRREIEAAGGGGLGDTESSVHYREQLRRDYASIKSKCETVYSLLRWTRPGQTFRNHFDQGNSNVTQSLRAQFTADRDDILDHRLGDYYQVGKCFGSPFQNDCDSRDIDKILNTAPEPPKVTIRKDGKRSAEASNFVYAQAPCFRGVNDAVAEDIHNNWDLGWNAVVAVVTAGGSVLEQAAAKAVELAAVARAASIGVKVLEGMNDVRGVIDALKECKQVLNKWEGPLQKLPRYDIPSCPGSNGDRRLIENEFAADLRSCVLMTTLSIAPVALPHLVGFVGRSAINDTKAASHAAVEASGRETEAFVKQFGREDLEIVSSASQHHFVELVHQGQTGLYFHSENAFLKEMNNVDFSLATAVSNKYKTILLDKLRNSPQFAELHRLTLGQYSDYKVIRLLFKDDSPHIRALAEELAKESSDDLARFCRGMKFHDKKTGAVKSLDQLLAHRNGAAHSAEGWHFSGVSGESDLLAERAAREGRTMKGHPTGFPVHANEVAPRIVGRIDETEALRQKIQTLLPRDKGMLVEAAGHPGQYTLSADLIEIFRSAKSEVGGKSEAAYQNYIRNRVQNRFGHKLTPEELHACKVYFSNTDLELVGLYQLGKGGISAPEIGKSHSGDLAGLGPMNYAAAQSAMIPESGERALAPTARANRVLGRVQKSADTVTDQILAVDRKLASAGDQAGVKLKISRSGDDYKIEVDPRYHGGRTDMTAAEESKVLESVAHQGIGKRLRFMTVPERFSKAAKESLGGDLAKIEKKMRIDLEGRIRKRFGAEADHYVNLMNQSPIAISLRDHPAGGKEVVDLLVGSTFTADPELNRVLQDSFKAIVNEKKQFAPGDQIWNGTRVISSPHSRRDLPMKFRTATSGRQMMGSYA